MQSQHSPIVSAPCAQDVLLFQSHRQITELFKSYLFMIEELKEQHDIAINKLIECLPLQYKDFVKLADYYDEEQFQILRRKILASGNDCKRQFETLIENFEIDYKDKR